MGVALYDIYGPGLYIEDPPGDPGFMSQARASLNCLRSRDSGVALLKAIADACRDGKHEVVIEKSDTANAIPTEDISESFRQQLRQPGNGLLVDDAYKLVVRGKGGSSAIARWNPSNTIPGTKIERPSYISLAHELIHCLHFITGDCARAPTREFDLKKDSGLAEEEARTVGIAAYDYPAKYKGLCENMFREEFGQSKRDSYAPGITLEEAKRSG
jgi:hypothetical protein